MMTDKSKCPACGAYTTGGRHQASGNRIGTDNEVLMGILKNHFIGIKSGYAYCTDTGIDRSLYSRIVNLSVKNEVDRSRILGIAALLGYRYDGDGGQWVRNKNLSPAKD